MLAGMASAFAWSHATAASAQDTAIDTGRLRVPNDGVTDATAALRAAAQAVPDSGGTLRLAPGRYLVSETIFIKGGTSLVGNGATLVAHPRFRLTREHDAHGGKGMMLLANMGHDANNFDDRRIAVAAVAFDLSAVPRGEFHAIRFRKVDGVRVSHCAFQGGGDGTAFLACRNTEVAYCRASGTLNCAYDHWEGTSSALVHDCQADCGHGYGILFTGSGTDTARDDATARDFVARNNIIQGSSEAAIWICSLSRGSVVANVSVVNNRIRNLRAGSGIGVTGACQNVVVQGNDVDGVRGSSAIFVRPDRWNRPSNIMIVANRLTNIFVGDRDIAAIQAVGEDVTVQGNRVTGSYPHLVWAGGDRDRIIDNAGDPARTRFPYATQGSKHLTVVQP